MSIEVRKAEDGPDYLKELLAQAGIDAQASSVAAKLQEVVIGELHHRMKNTLAIVSAITSHEGPALGWKAAGIFKTTNTSRSFAELAPDWISSIERPASC